MFPLKSHSTRDLSHQKLMRVLKHLFDNNRIWAEEIGKTDPEFFQRLSRQQSPSYLWIGCSDSRVPANQIVGLLPGEMFVHRNIANVVDEADLNCMSVLQFAIDVLKVRHVIVCGHYGCAGIGAALRGEALGLVDGWLRHVREVREKHMARLIETTDEIKRSDRLCELNVIEQVMKVCHAGSTRNAWANGRELVVHGWIYGLKDGLLRDLNMSVSAVHEEPEVYSAALAALR
jgi:carbonic anhydrase